jgi:DNA-binding beta-propeller fold protein YncE
VHPSGLIVVADELNDRIRLVDPTSGVVTTLAGSVKGYADGTGAAANFNGPSGVAVIPSSGVIVVADGGNKRIRLVTYPGGVVTTLAGQTTAGSADGTGAGASFRNPRGVTIDSLGNIIVADTSNHRIRRITYPEGVVTTLAGSGTATFANGTGTGASFGAPTGVALNPLTGAIVVGDQDNHRIRVIT